MRAKEKDEYKDVDVDDDTFYETNECNAYWNINVAQRTFLSYLYGLENYPYPLKTI